MIVHCWEEWYDGNHIRYEAEGNLYNFPDNGLTKENKLTQEAIEYVSSYMNWETNEEKYNSDNPWIKRYYVKPILFRDYNN